MARKKVAKIAHVTYTVGAALSDAYDQLRELGDELREWYDNMPFNFQGTDNGEAVNDAADALEDLSEIGVSETQAEISFEHSYSTSNKRKSRAVRRDDACQLLNAARDALQEFVDAKLALVETDPSLQSLDAHDALAEEVESLQNEIDGLIEDAEGIEFPGRY